MSRADVAPVTILRRHLNSVSCLEWFMHAQQLWLVSACTGGAVLVWNLRTRRVCWELQLGRNRAFQDGDMNVNVVRVHILCDSALPQASGIVLLVQCKNGHICGYRLPSSIFEDRCQTDGDHLVGDKKFSNAQRQQQESPEAVIFLETRSVSFMQFAVLERNKGQSMGNDEGVAAKCVLLASSSMNGEDVCIWDCGTQERKAVVEIAKLCRMDGKSSSPKLGMVMCCRLLELQDGSIFLLCGMESGHLVGIGDVGEEQKAPSRLFIVKVSDEPVLTLDVILQVRGNGNACWVVGFCGGAGFDVCRFKVNLCSLSTMTLDKIALPREGVSRVRIRDDNKIVAAASWDHRTRLYAFKKLTPLAILKTHTATVNDIAFAPGSSLLATGSRDGSVAIFDVFRRQGEEDRNL